MYKRILNIDLASKETVFLWGARQTGKSTLLHSLFPKSLYKDLLKSDVYMPLLNRPSLLREELEAAEINGDTQKFPVIIDEVQKVPALLDEIHWLMENRGIRFILCGSSARKLKRNKANLLGGRAVRYELYPLVFPEIDDFDLLKALNKGLLPRHYLSPHPNRLLHSYVNDYLKEEIYSESLTRNLPAFSRFLEVSALSNGELINFSNIASECGISSPTVREYYNITVDTLLGRFLPAFRKKSKRRQILAPKFYYFDVGVTSKLSFKEKIIPGSDSFGKAFEHFIVNEITANSSYSEKFFKISYWKSASGFEVDLVLGDTETAVEIKSSNEIRNRHLKGMRAFKEEFTARKYLVVSLDKEPRKTPDGIEILPWKTFLERLWQNEII